MATLGDAGINIGQDVVSVSPFEGASGMDFSRSLWDQVVSDYNKQQSSSQNSIQQWQNVLSDPNNPYWTANTSGDTSLEGRTRAAQNSLDYARSVASANPAITSDGVPSNLKQMLIANLVSPTYGNAEDQYFGARDQEVFRRRADERSSGIGSIMRTAVPIGMSLIGAGLGTAAFAPGLLGGGATAGATGISAGGGYSSGLGSALGNFATDAALSGAVKGGIGGLVSGGDLSSALKGAALGGVTGGYGQAIGSGLGLTGSGLQGFTGALQGASGGLAQGDLKSAALGALMGGGSSYLQSGGSIPGLGSMGGSTLDQTTGVTGLQGPTQGTGILGGIGRASSGLSNLTGSTGGSPMNLGSLLSAGGDVYGYFQGKSDLDDIQKMLAEQSGRAEAQYSPYAQAGQTALGNLQAPDLEALQADPGYQFQLGQGQQALERSFAAQGLGQSGAALKAAQEYGQGLASQTYDDYFNRQSQIANLGYGAAGGLGSIYSNLGNVQAAAELERMNQRNNMLSGLGGLFG